MKKFIYLIKRKPGISREQFRNHYETKHLPLAWPHFGHLLEKYVRNYPQTAVGIPTGLSPGKTEDDAKCEYDAITEMWVKEENLAEFEACWPKMMPLLYEDELRFLDRDAVVMAVCDEVETNLKTGKAL